MRNVESIKAGAWNAKSGSWSKASDETGGCHGE